MTEQAKPVPIDLCKTPKVELAISATGESLIVEYKCPESPGPTPAPSMPPTNPHVIKDQRRSPSSASDITGSVELLHATEPAEEMATQELKSWLSQVLDKRFSQSELRETCFHLSIDWDHLAGDEKKIKLLELIGYLERRDRLAELVRYIHQKRPNILLPVSWIQIT